jgi:branched-chain amino acid transport system ATP-binding protein
MTQPLLSLRNINTFYGPIHILQDVSLDVQAGEIVCLLGGNACGKSTTLKTILGIVQPASGEIRLNGEVIHTHTTGERIARGIAVVPENRRIFGPLSVHENVLLGAYRRRDRAALQDDLERVYTIFPRLAERQQQAGGTLSGGEQQMLALGRALMSRPRLILMDEPSMGLAPRLVEQTLAMIAKLNQQGITIVMVEQHANHALAIAHRGYVLQTGRIVLSGSATTLRNHADLRRAYLGR